MILRFNFIYYILYFFELSFDSSKAKENTDMNSISKNNKI